MMFSELSRGCWSLGQRNMFRLPQSFSLSVTCTYMSPLLEVGCFCLLLTYVRTLFIGSQNFISPPSFMFVSAAVCEIPKFKKEKKTNSEIDYFQFKTFPGHIIYLNVPFKHMSRTPQTESDYQELHYNAGPALYTLYCCTV